MINLLQWSIFTSSLAINEISQLLRDIIMIADIYEEEDFNIQLYNHHNSNNNNSNIQSFYYTKLSSSLIHNHCQNNHIYHNQSRSNLQRESVLIFESYSGKTKVFDQKREIQYL